MALLIRKIPDPTYDKQIYLVKGTFEQIKAWWPSKLGAFDWEKRIKGYYICGTEWVRPRHFVFLNTSAPANRGITLLATLSHEVLHLAFNVLRDAGVKYCDASEEAYTYWFDSIFSRMVRAAKLL